MLNFVGFFILKLLRKLLKSLLFQQHWVETPVCNIIQVIQANLEAAHKNLSITLWSVPDLA